MQTRSLLSLSLLLALAIPLAAADAPPAGLAEWGRQLLGYCPDETFELEPASVPAPDGFTAWSLRQKSSWGPCAQRTTLFASANQAIAGRAFPLAADPRPLEERIAERAKPLLKKDVTAKVESKKLPDGMREVRLEFASPEGPMPIMALLDRSGSHLVIGVRGTIGTDPALELMEALSKGGASRGKKGAKVVILEISDPQCPACASLHEALEPFVKENLAKIEYRRADFSLFEQHDWSLAAAAAARAIWKVAPESYWDYLDFIFKRQPDLKAETIATAVQDFAEGNDLDWKRIEKEMNSPAVRRAVVAQLGTFFGYGIFSTPTILVNGRMIPHAGTGAPVMEYVKELLAK
jgi:protein-disulfide isomerase